MRYVTPPTHLFVKRATQKSRRVMPETEVQNRVQLLVLGSRRRHQCLGQPLDEQRIRSSPICCFLLVALNELGAFALPILWSDFDRLSGIESF